MFLLVPTALVKTIRSYFHSCKYGEQLITIFTLLCAKKSILDFHKITLSLNVEEIDFYTCFEKTWAMVNFDQKEANFYPRRNSRQGKVLCETSEK